MRAEVGEVDQGLLLRARVLAVAANAQTRVTQRRWESSFSQEDGRALDEMVSQATLPTTTDSEAPVSAATGMPNQTMRAPCAVIRVTDESALEVYRSSAAARIKWPAPRNGFFNVEMADTSHRGASHRPAGGRYAVQLLCVKTDGADEVLKIALIYYLIPLFAFLPVVALVAWLSSRRMLKPLNRVAALIAKRDPADLTPIAEFSNHTEIRPLVKEINALLGKLNHTLEREREFIADAAHEMRTPLAVIQTQAHVLRHATTQAEKSLAATELDQGVERAADLMRKLLLSACVSDEAFVPHFTSTVLSNWAQDRMAAWSDAANTKGIELELIAPPNARSVTAKLDLASATSALDNVLDNAIRYSPNGASIVVTVQGADSSGRVGVSISDTGPGIDSHWHARVFERFFRVPGTESSGSGLGLNIVQRIMSLHKGQVKLCSGPNGQGTRVDLMWPT